MTSTTPARFTLDYGGHHFAVETTSAGLGTIGRLFVDGQQVDEQKGKDSKITLQGGGLTVVVVLNWLDQIRHILAVPSGADPKKVEEEGIAFAPPPGSHAARMEKLAREHPALYAARHVVLAVAQVLAGALGISALLWAIVEGLLPRIDVPLPDINLPAIPWPDVDLPAILWPDIPLPAIDLPDLTFLAPLKALWSSFNWLVPIIIAIIVAINEVEKRRKRERRGS